MVHSSGFLRLVNEARSRVREVSVDEARTRLEQSPSAVLADVREDSEWLAGHASSAIHLGKGVLERDLERTIPDPNTEIYMYCGGGYRSVLTCEIAQRMGYGRVYSIIGGHRAMVTDGWPMAVGGAEPAKA